MRVTQPCNAPRMWHPPPDPEGIVWEEPPPRGKEAGRLIRLRGLLPVLKQHPGRWARVFEYKGPTGASSAVGKMRREFPDLELRGARRDAGSAIYARYRGDD